MAIDEILDMNIIPDAGAIRRRIIASIQVEDRTLLGGSKCIGYQVGFRLMPFISGSSSITSETSG